MLTALKDKSIGSIIKIKIWDGDIAQAVDTDFILTNLGAPNSSYKNANGAWLTQKNIQTTMMFNSNNNQAYANSCFCDTKYDFEGNYLSSIDSKLQPYILTPTLPIAAGISIGATTITKKVFLLSITETGATTLSNDGSKLSYFSNNSSRIARYGNGQAEIWWTRSPYSNGSNCVYCVSTNGDWNYDGASCSDGVRPTFIINSSLLVDENGYIHVNRPPVISSSLGASGTDLGEKKDVFNVTYSVSNPDGNALTVTEKIDNVTVNTRTNISSDSLLTFSNLNDLTSFQKILNGEHTLEIIANNGKEISFTFTFTKKVTEADITLKNALAVDGDISVAILKIEGSIPKDAIVTALVTNNGKDPNPAWQDATIEVLNNKNIVFTNKENTNGAAFNFKVKIKRGPSDKGGYITSINGAFQ